MKAFALTFILVASMQANAQGITLLEFTPEATMLAPKGVLKACGLGFEGIRHVPGTESDFEQVSGSIAIYTDGFTLVKAGHRFGTLKNGEVKIRLPGTQIAWIRVEGEETLVAPDGGLVPGESEPFLLFSVSPKQAVSAISAMLGGKTIWIGFSKADTVRHIFSGSVKRDAVVAKQVDSCFAEWSKTQPSTKAP